MQITQRIPKFSIVIISLIFFWITYKAAIGIADGKLKLIYLGMGLSILIMIPYVVDKIGSFPLLCGLVFIYWIPFKTQLGYYSPHLSLVYPTEFGMWMLCIGILIHNSVSQSAQWNSAVGRFPFLPFMLLIAGALIANLVSKNLFAGDELIRIRLFCLLPAFICFLCIYLIKTVKQAEYLLWLFLISSGLLGLVFLYGPQIDPDLCSVSASIEKGDRIVRMIRLPFFGNLGMRAASTPVCFAFITALSFNLWLNHSSFWKRLVAAGILAISGLVIIRAQGRAGLVAATCSIVIIMILSLRSRKYLFSSFSGSLLKAGIVILLLFGSVWYYASISTIESFRHHGLSLFTNPLAQDTFSGRFLRWKTSVDVVLDNPFGVGIYGFPSASGQSWYAHNLYLFLLLSFGIIGFLGFFWIFLRFTKAYWSGLHSNNLDRWILSVGGMGFVITLLVAGLTLGVYWEPWQVLVVWIPVGITIAAAMLKEESHAK